MGGDWRMPTMDELQELIDNTTRSWTTLNGVKGNRLTSKKNSNTIFFPAAGAYSGTNINKDFYGYYWSSSLVGSYIAYYLESYSTKFGVGESGNIKSYQHSVRGVIEKPIEYTYTYVDLGLSVLWATCNIGATSPEDYGDYYTWGGRTNKSTSDYYKGSGDLPITSDTARNKMGGEWRLPTQLEVGELRDNCDRIWTTQGGKRGYLLTSKKNGQEIFFPAAGQYNSGMSNVGDAGIYWTSTWVSYNELPWAIVFTDINFSVNLSNPSHGLTIRGVHPK